MFLPSKDRRKKTEQDVSRVIDIFGTLITAKKHFRIENFFFLDQAFDGVTCFLPSFDFRAFSAQACIVSALSFVAIFVISNFEFIKIES